MFFSDVVGVRFTFNAEVGGCEGKQTGKRKEALLTLYLQKFYVRFEGS